MKRIIFSLLALVLTGYIVNAQTTTPAANPNAPVLKFDKTTHDYGTVEKGGDGTCEFVFKNTGVEPLILSNVQSSCGCTVPEWPKEPVLKGKSAVIRVKYDTNRLGPINKTITVTSNATNSPIQLRITGNVVQKAEGQGLPEKTSGEVPQPK